MVFIIVMAGWLFSLTLHEYAHARVAYAGGDHTVREKGYLTFNPIRYMDPMMSVLMPLLFVLMGGIALPGGLVYVRHDLLRSPWWSTGVALAGPAMNVLCALLCAAPFALGLAPAGPYDAGAAWTALAYLGVLQVMAAVLNLLPIPALDGFGAIEPHLSREARYALLPIRRYGILAVFLLLWFVEPVNRAFFRFVATTSHEIGIPLDFADAGRAAMPKFRL